MEKLGGGPVWSPAPTGREKSELQITNYKLRITNAACRVQSAACFGRLCHSERRFLGHVSILCVILSAASKMRSRRIRFFWWCGGRIGLHPSAQCAHWTPPLKGRLWCGGGIGLHPSAQCAHWTPPLKGRLGCGGGIGIRAEVVFGPSLTKGIFWRM